MSHNSTSTNDSFGRSDLVSNTGPSTMPQRRGTGDTSSTTTTTDSRGSRGTAFTGASSLYSMGASSFDGFYVPTRLQPIQEHGFNRSQSPASFLLPSLQIGTPYSSHSPSNLSGASTATSLTLTPGATTFPHSSSMQPPQASNPGSLDSYHRPQVNTGTEFDHTGTVAQPTNRSTSRTSLTSRTSMTSDATHPSSIATRPPSLAAPPMSDRSSLKDYIGMNKEAERLRNLDGHDGSPRIMSINTSVGRPISRPQSLAPLDVRPVHNPSAPGSPLRSPRKRLFSSNGSR